MQEKELILEALGLMLLVVIPVIIMTIYFSYQYRESNKEAKYTPEWCHSSKIEFVVWAIPVLIIIILGTITWESTHRLDPYQKLDHPEKAIEVQVISLDWKWLFVYPEQGIATINHLAMPTNVPVDFKLTSDNLMNSFFIPRLGTQIYTMPSMATQLSLIATEPGEYKGVSSGYSGHGFSDMKFTVTALKDRAAFADWVAKIKESPEKILNKEQYLKLTEPTTAHPVTYYSYAYPQLFDDAVMRWPGAMNMDMGKRGLTGMEATPYHAGMHSEEMPSMHRHEHATVSEPVEKALPVTEASAASVTPTQELQIKEPRDAMVNDAEHSATAPHISAGE